MNTIPDASKPAHILTTQRFLITPRDRSLQERWAQLQRLEKTVMQFEQVSSQILATIRSYTRPASP